MPSNELVPIPRWRWGALAIVTALALGLQLWRFSNEFGYELSYLAFVGVSLLSSFAVPIAIVNIAIALPWLLWPWGRAPNARRRLVQLNRWAGHAEALLGFLTLSMVLVPWVVVQLPLAGAVVLLGGRVVDRLAVRTGAQGDEAEILWARRPIIYFATAASLAMFILVAPRQSKTLAPLLTAISIGVVLRAAAVFLRRRAITKADDQELTERRTFRVDIAEGARRYDGWVTLAIVTAAFLLPLLWLPIRKNLKLQDEKDSQERAVVREPPLARSDVSLFLVADSQFHELDGKTSGVHLDLVDTIVPVAVRPIELDLLSESTLRHFASLYKALHKPGMLWAHLGDAADLGCEGELARLHDAFAELAAVDRLAGIAPGNHDNTFVGNFAWHPDWDGACNGRPADTEISDRALREATKDFLVAGAAVESRHRESGALTPAGDWLATVSPLGASGGRKVVGVFVDTSDRGAVQLGVAGVFGSISRDQADWLAAHAKQLGGENPLYVVFLHHPYDELDLWSRATLRRLVRALGDGTLALVTAHTHLSARRMHDGILGRALPEYVLGSTIDPPQEAALLEVGVDGAGKVAVQLETVPAMARPGQTCAPIAGELTLDTCDHALENLKRACPAWLATVEKKSPETGGIGFTQALKYFFRSHDHPATPGAVRRAREARARALVDCLGLEAVKDPMSDAEVFPALRRAYETRAPELVCLSWAASVLQAYKHTTDGPHSIAEAASQLAKQTADPPELLGAKRWVNALP